MCIFYFRTWIVSPPGATEIVALSTPLSPRNSRSSRAVVALDQHRVCIALGDANLIADTHRIYMRMLGVCGVLYVIVVVGALGCASPFPPASPARCRDAQRPFQNIIRIHTYLPVVPVPSRRNRPNTNTMKLYLKLFR